jgi:hypothetical protein
MKLSELAKLWILLDGLDDEMDDAKKGDAVAVPETKGIKLNGRRWTLRNAELVAEQD